MEANIALTIAMCPQQGMASEDLEIWSSDDFPSILKDLCGLMVAIHDNKLSLLHSTVRTFLVFEGPADSPDATQQLSIKGPVGDDTTQRDWEGCLDMSNAHGLMCQICLNYLTLSDFAINPAEVDHNNNYDCYDDGQRRNERSSEFVYYNDTKSRNDFLEEPLNRYAFLNYCAFNCPHHYRQQDQQHRSILQVDAELMCTPNSGFFVKWASRAFLQKVANLLSRCDGLGIASYLGLADLIERFSLSADHIDAYQPIYPHTALRIAIKRGFPDVVRVLLSKGADSSLQDGYGGSPLYEALQQDSHTSLSDRVTILQMLFDSDLDINSKTVKGHTALYHASLPSTENLVGFLVERGADLEAPTGYWDRTPLQEAIVFGREHQTAHLLKYGADFKARAKSKDTLLSGAGKFWSVLI